VAKKAQRLLVSKTDIAALQFGEDFHAIALNGLRASVSVDVANKLIQTDVISTASAHDTNIAQVHKYLPDLRRNFVLIDDPLINKESPMKLSSPFCSL